MKATHALPALLVFAAAGAAAEGPAWRTFDVSADDPLLERDPRGLSLFIPQGSRTPTGRAYDRPYERPLLQPLGEGWRYTWASEIGGVASRRSGDAAAQRNYRDYRDGLLVNRLDIGLEEAGSARYAGVWIAAPGRDDQTYRAEFGRYGDFRIGARFQEMPRLFTDQARTVFQGAGTGTLTLADGLVPGNNSPARVAAALQSVAPLTLGYTRKNAGVDFDMATGEAWRVYARYDQERKNGTRASGGAAGFPGIPLVETVEPIDYRTHNVQAGAQWVGARAQANLSYAGSLFRNGIDTLTWDYPLAVNPGVLRRGRMDLYPDNASHNVKLESSAALPLRGRVTGTLSYTRMTQDDALVAPVANTGIVAGLPPANLANWNTTAALDQATANARIDTRLMQLTGSFSPWQDLNVNARLRRQDENNRTRYAAFNPLTGQSGYIALDGGVNDVVPSFLRGQLQSIPYEYRKSSYGIDADYPLLRRTGLTAGLEREDTGGQYRERNRTTENRIRLALNNRDVSWATLRLSYEHARRDGEGYAYDPNRAFYAPTALVNAPATLADLRKFDVADRRQDALNARAQLIVSDAMDVAITARHLDNRYGAEYGRRDERTSAFNVEWSWTPRPTTSAYAYYGFQRSRNRMASIADNPAGYASGDPNAGGAVYPLSNRWDEHSRDDSHAVGLGLNHAFDHTTRLETAYSYVYSPYRTRYAYASPGALVGGAAAAAAAGDGMPDMLFRQQTLATSLRIALDKTTAIRLFHRYDRAHYGDWHYDGLQPLFAGGAALFLGAGARDYRMHTIGVFWQYTPGKRERSGE